MGSLRAYSVIITSITFRSTALLLAGASCSVQCRAQGGQRTQWLDDSKEWTGITIPVFVSVAKDRGTYRRFICAVAHTR